MSVIKDIAGQGSLTRTVDGFQVERVYIVDDVEGIPESRLYNAMATTGVPQYGDPHPIIPDIQVTRITATPEASGDQIRVDVAYTVQTAEESTDTEGDLASGIPVVSAALINEDTFLDVNGEFMSVSYTTLFTGGIFIRTHKNAQISVQRPQMRVTLFGRHHWARVPKIVDNRPGEL